MNEVCLLFTEDVLRHHSYGFHLKERDKKKLVFGEGQAMSILDA